jgi:hypothetical protein
MSGRLYAGPTLHAARMQAVSAANAQPQTALIWLFMALKLCFRQLNTYGRIVKMR